MKAIGKTKKTGMMLVRTAAPAPYAYQISASADRTVVEDSAVEADGAFAPFVTQDAADLGHGCARTQILLADLEEHAADVAQDVIDHQPLDFAINRTAPMGARQEGPADLDLVALGVVAGIATGADHFAACAIEDREPAAACQRR